MKPIDFPQSTKVLQRPSTMSERECQSLPVWCDGEQCVSCWKPSFKERVNILLGGKVWLGVMSGKTQPPVFVAGKRVFDEAPFFVRFKAFWVEVGESIAEVCKSLAEATKQSDKRKHCLVGALIGLFLGCLLGWQWGFTIGCLAGAIKEWWDGKGHGTVELMDFVCTVIGALCGASLSIGIMWLFHLIM